MSDQDIADYAAYIAASLAAGDAIDMIEYDEIMFAD